MRMCMKCVRFLSFDASLERLLEIAMATAMDVMWKMIVLHSTSCNWLGVQSCSSRVVVIRSGRRLFFVASLHGWIIHSETSIRRRTSSLIHPTTASCNNHLAISTLEHPTLNIHLPTFIHQCSSYNMHKPSIQRHLSLYPNNFHPIFIKME